MIHLYDGNNVMRRAMDKGMPQARPMTIRMRYEEACMARPGTQIWCWDGRQHNERRREIYPLYKTNREPTPEDIFSQIRLFREVMKLAPVTQIEVHGWEADDVIGTLVRKMPGKCIVHTNDMDYGQIDHLCKLDGVKMKGIPGRWIPLYKALVGDSSDNIKGIPGFGDTIKDGVRTGAWIKVQDYLPQIERAIVAGDPAGFVGLPVTKGVAAWLAVQENIDLLQSMLLVTHFQNVPDDELNGGITVGKMDRLEADAKLSEFFL